MAISSLNGHHPTHGAASRAALLVIVPAYNEAANIAYVVEGVRQDVPYADVLVVDDGSCDGTGQAARRAGAVVLSLPFNLGIGGAVQAGFKFAHRLGYPFAARMDADGQHNPRDLHTLLEVVRSGVSDVAVGSRFAHAVPDRATPFIRRVGCLGFAIVVSGLTGQPARDTTSGMQCLNRRALACFSHYYPQDYPEVEARIILHRARLRVVEVPVVMRPRRAGRSSINRPRAVYYVFKVLLATLIAAVREPWTEGGLEYAA